MPRLAGEDGSDIDDVYEEAGVDVDTEAKQQLNGELKDNLDNDAESAPSRAKDDDDEEDLTTEAKAREEDEEDDEDEEAEEYNVESIQDHKFVKGQLLYFIKWQGYPASQNTWEPEEHLLPHSRLILAAYHKRIGVIPQAPMKKGKSKQSLRETASSEDLPPPKRQKRNGAKYAKDAEQDLSWLPKGDQWEPQVEKVETIERDEETKQLMAYILFKNGKRSKISMDMVYKHCPRPMLRFYEEHLKFK
ncbi:hypothetical protein A1O7_00526 [Cladophialophora yegresii CBS 114405]|uniref:Chromo domain-containing protein n=1 Tax=Cladophialophora yegresii CBS 114405 TaxID=1182544 RepID=W9WGR7_9EURO|nr:uncharacterized protein A1O7_00526 [Cladophialophora yegresii CBS 114405]EXJ64190.1 hypothetical protein A1O7_00526 [Cladophialophora yegresii CBS 114405]